MQTEHKFQAVIRRVSFHNVRAYTHCNTAHGMEGHSPGLLSTKLFALDVIFYHQKIETCFSHDRETPCIPFCVVCAVCMHSFIHCIALLWLSHICLCFSTNFGCCFFFLAVFLYSRYIFPSIDDGAWQIFDKTYFQLLLSSSAVVLSFLSNFA